jgi:RNA polymerase sigma factor for flagellar operon FliA
MAKQLASSDDATGERIGTFVSFDDLPAETEMDRGSISPFAALTRQLDYEALGKAMACLPERELAVVQARYYEGSAIHEIAERLGVSPSRASQLHASALRRLKAALDAAEA